VDAHSRCGHPDLSLDGTGVCRFEEWHPALRVVTYNLLHDGADSGFLNGKTHLKERLEMATRELKTLDPDIIAVQEASDSRRHGNVPERLARELGFHIVFAPATDHVFGIWPIDTVVVSIMGFK
jgi:endonuclease/exonuclease/phosphatase family metal-dependent hydrolase